MKTITKMDGVIWITGASSGIGRALALAHAEAGWTVGVTARREAELNALLAERHPGRIVAAPADVTDPEAGWHAVETVTSAGPIVRAILNAGTYERDSADSFTAARLRDQVELNLLGVANCLEAVMPAMIARRSGQLALMSSLAGLSGLPGTPSYSATKAALVAIAESLKFDLDRNGVGISVICPGYVKSPMTEGSKLPMPFLMETDAAAATIMRGLDANRFLIAFPPGLAWPVRVLRSLPHPLFFAALRRFARARSRA